jgi:V/A-type H+/Na+-transporting ATPase subunit D
VSSESPTRSRLIALGEERRAMREGYVFLDEKCLLLAAEMTAELKRYDVLRAAFEQGQREARRSLEAALLRHGLDGLAVYPALAADGIELRLQRRSLLGIALCRSEAAMRPLAAPPAVFPSPEAETCRAAFVALTAAAAPLAAATGNLLRLHREYRRTLRRACAIHDVVLPELDLEFGDIEVHLDEMEREEALWIRASRARP